jgi:secreted Zn-dependent insulinase-like peptidase
MFSRFFVDPLIKTEAAERELKAIDSEFQESENEDFSRIDELFF